MSILTIPQNNPKAGYLAHQTEIDAAIREVLESGWYILGKQVTQFEEKFAAFVGVNHAIGVANGTDALHLALRGLEIGAGDSVITVSHTAVATVAAIELAGATPILVDVDPNTYLMDLNQVEEVLRSFTLRPKAILPVHLYGQMVDMPALLGLAHAYGARVIEDCSQAHGAAWQGQQAGSFGDVAAFSLYPTKNLGALGDGGVIATHNQALAARIRQLREYGWEQRISQIPGLNSRLDEMQAAILRVKLPYLAGENARRQTIAHEYKRGLSATGFTLPVVAPPAAHVYHQFVIRTAQRDRLQQWLRQQGISTLIHYPQPVHLQPAYMHRLPTSPSLAQTERIVQEILSLPIFPQLNDVEVASVIDGLGAFAC